MVLSSRPNPGLGAAYPILTLLEKCSTKKELFAIHAHAITLSLLRYTYITSRILASFAISTHGSIDHARLLFDRIPLPTAFNWNTMIKGYSRSPHPEKGLLIYSEMRCRGVDPNMHTFPFAIKSCATCFLHLFQVHGQVFKFGFDTDVYVVSSFIRTYSECGSVELAFQMFDESPNRNVVSWTSLISGCCAHGLVDRARDLFDGMPEKNDVSWSAMISGYVKNERYKEAIELFCNLRDQVGMKLNGSLLVSVLNACASLGALKEGKWVHSYVDQKSMGHGLEIGTALVDFYSKCGSIETAREVFDKMPLKDVTAWSAMIMGLAINGHSRPVLEMFSKMLGDGIAPNNVTFIGVLTACNHGGLAEEGWDYFEAMSKVFGISPGIEHYGCMVDLLARAGLIEEAMRLIKSMPIEPDGAIWGSLLSGCSIHDRVELGEKVGRRVIELDSGHGGRYVSLANVYATVGRWEGVVNVRAMMRERGVAAIPGWSSVETDGLVCRFLVGDKSHPKSVEIYEMLGRVYRELESSS